MSYEYLYEWQMLAHDEMATDSSCFIEVEKNMTEHGIRTRVILNESIGGYELWVPQKDHEVAHALYTREVRAVIDVPREIYHVFEGDLSFKNKALYEDPYKVKRPYGRYRSILIIGLILLIMLFVFRFVKVS
jgi:hypothetical protein